MGWSLIAIMLGGIALTALPSASATYPVLDANGNPLEPNPTWDGNLTYADHFESACDGNVLCYVDDGGHTDYLTAAGFNLSPKVNNPITYKISNTECTYIGKTYPGSSVGATTSNGWCSDIQNQNWLQIGNWTKSIGGSATNNTFSLVKRNGADALQFSNPGGNPGTVRTDAYTLTFATPISYDPRLRLFIGAEITAIGLTSSEPNAEVNVLVYDSNLSSYDSFYYWGGSETTQQIVPNPGGNSFRHGSLMNNTGSTFWDPLLSQGQPVNGGVANGVGKIVIDVNDDSASHVTTNMYLWALQIGVKRFQFGTDYLGRVAYNKTYSAYPGGPFTLSTPPVGLQLAAFAPNYDYYDAHNLEVAYEVPCTSLPAGQMTLTSQQTGSATYPWTEDLRCTFLVPRLDNYLNYAGDEKISYYLTVPGSQQVSVLAGGADITKTLALAKTGTYAALLTGPALGVKQIVEIQTEYTPDEMNLLTGGQGVQIGAAWFQPGSWVANIWVELAGLAGVGSAFTWALARRHL